MISWKATANGIVSVMPIVNGEGPRDDPMPTLGLRNSKLPTLSALAICEAGLIRPRTAASDLRDGGLGIAILLPPADVGVGICRCVSLVRLADAGAEALISPTSEKMSPKSA